MTRVALVLAAARNGVIGKNGALPWRIADDLRFFKSVTLGKPVVMGRRTFDSIDKILPGRRNIVVTRDAAWRREGVETARDVLSAIGAAKTAAVASGVDEIAIIGGAEIYRAALPFADRIYLTRVDADVDGDVRFEPPAEGWRETPLGRAAAGAGNQYGCNFVRLDREVIR